MEVSLRYPPVVGRLHTRYAPVRRSPARYCYRLLPLDLHVLSLPLAFILSQDQTLHCKNCSFTFLTRLRVSHISLYVCRHTLSLSSHPFQISLAFFSTAVFSAKADAKIQPFSNTPKYFFKNFHSVMPTALYYSAMHLKKIFTPRGFPPRKTAPPGPKRGKIGAAGAKNGIFRCQNAVSRCTTAVWLHRSPRGGASYQQRRPLPSPTEPLRTRYGRSSVVLQ